MKLMTATALGLTLAATGAMADNHGDGNGEMNTEANAEMQANDEAMQSEGNTQADMDTAQNAPMQMTSQDLKSRQGEMIRTRDITGGVIYTTNEADDEGWDSANMYDEVGAEWNEIGEIEDVILTQDGQMAGIVGEVGGFLDIADKHVMISVSDVNLVAVDDRTYAYVTRLNEEDLESMEGVDEAAWN